MRIAMLLAVGLCAASARATEALPAPDARAAYSEFRISLALQGWKPGRDARTGPTCTSGRTRICETFAEAVTCQRTTPSRCLFLWKKNATQIEVETVGSQPYGIRVDQMRCRAGCAEEGPPWTGIDR
ncbi:MULTISPECIES: hypothetical protein [Methylobacterium]|jgi:hypothetical protein|uniref:Uncharacterized protein n=1 Tax=Methylobacterium isbiliense TaxID=315478 RepID=A0ABQ4SIZ1_9HYPH|nr:MULTISPECIES: hypothetical protein [Methylobacterium]MBY0297926.1 hypothetical protein [Methylobacterium sp.]MDN3625352.1 hypothetical protein [Methylobacterium isbiliense]GJE03180.1 hypothetical protein GMJLKIPL_5131 [Methylobacterium isbiliense]